MDSANGSASSAARQQVSGLLQALTEPGRSPLFAAIGMGDVARGAVVDTVRRVRADMRQRAESANDTFTLAFGELPTNIDQLRHQLEPAELRKRLDNCKRFGVELYEFLNARGEIAVDRLQRRPEPTATDGPNGSGASVARRLAVAAAEDVRDLTAQLLRRITER